MTISFQKIDLHMHSTISDGTDSPKELLDRLRQTDIDFFSVTDHDAIKGGILMPGMLRKDDPAFVRGVEFSSRDEHGKYHILGYGYDPKQGTIREVVDRGHAMRMNKTRARISFLQDEMKMVFPDEQIKELLSQDNPGKPHIARMMIRNGYAESVQEAIGMINRKVIKNVYFDPEEVIKSILSSGGIPVLAHPAYGSGDEIIMGEELDARVQRLMGYGLAGLEAFYSGFTDKIQKQVLDLAEKYDLYVTAGSDYHGANKMVELGETNLEDMDQAPRGLRRFLDDVTIINGQTSGA